MRAHKFFMSYMVQNIKKTYSNENTPGDLY